MQDKREPSERSERKWEREGRLYGPDDRLLSIVKWEDKYTEVKEPPVPRPGQYL